MLEKEIDKSEKFWNRISKNYDGKVDKNSPAYIYTLNRIKKHINANDVVLDFACATGKLSINIADCIDTITGIDISSKMIERAKAKVAERKLENIFFKHLTIFDESLKNDTFDVILSFNIFHLLEEPAKVIKRLNELLKPGGLLISSTPCMGNKKYIFGVILFFVRKTGLIPYINAYTSTELVDVITKGNFHIMECERLQKKDLNYFIVAKKS